ncbi:swr complex subunit [Actinomortierella ambigua]|nr:swr complex subunit [Actinomortierella ambigua]
MASSSDVRDIFQLKPASDQVRRAPRTEKKPDGISRELYGLIGNNVSTVAFNNPAYKPKLNLRTKAVSWTWRPFVNPMRDDDLVLHHWQKTMTDPNEEYYFSRYNKIINLQEYTPEEYTKHLQDPDWTMEETAYLWDLCRRFDLRWVLIQDRYEWPPREEDAMAYRTIAGVVPKPEPTTQAQPSLSSSTDSSAAGGAAASNAMDTSSDGATAQAQPNGATPTTSTPSTTTDAAVAASSTPAAGAPPSTTATATTATPAGATPASSSAAVKKEEADIVRKTRTMEDLKARYYAINRTLIRLRMSDSSQAVEKAQLLSSMAYDKNREIERKKNLEILNTRTPEQIEEEEALYLEARRIDQNEKKITKERESLLRLLNLRDMYGPGGPASAGLSAGGSLVGGGGSGIIIPSNSINISSGPSSAHPGKGSAPATPVTPTAAGLGAAAGAAAAAGGAAAAAAAGSNAASTTAAATTTTGSGSNKKRKKNAKQTDDSGSTYSSTKGGSSNNRRLSNASAADATTATGNGGASAANAGASSAASTSSPSSATAVPPPVKKEKLTPGAYLRSQKMTPIVSTKITRVQNTLAQLDMPYKPNMPTATVMAKWDQLQTNIVTLLDLKKHVDKLENDLKVNKLRQSGGKGANAAAGAGGAASSASGAAAAGGQGGSAPGSLGLLPASSTGLAGADGDAHNTHYGVKREGAPDDASTTGQVKKKKSRKE